jgi:hypothetical protein
MTEKNPLITDIDLAKLTEALENADPDNEWEDGDASTVPEVILDAAANWLEHCTLEAMRYIMDKPSESDYVVPVREYEPTERISAALANKFPKSQRPKVNLDYPEMPEG